MENYTFVEDLRSDEQDDMLFNLIGGVVFFKFKIAAGHICKRKNATTRGV